jgi:hypothetical protein
MSTISASTTSSTAYKVTADTTGALVLQTGATPTTALTLSTAQNATFAGTVADSTGTFRPLVSGTAVASTSGTSIDFTSIPSWVKRITVMFSGVSTSSTSVLQFQLGAGSVTTSGYSSAGGNFNNANNTGVANGSTGVYIINSGNPANTYFGQAVFTTLGSNIWIVSGVYGVGSATNVVAFGGGITLSGTLDRVRITTVNGTDTFDAGSINILYE